MVLLPVTAVTAVMALLFLVDRLLLTAALFTLKVFAGTQLELVDLTQEE